MRKCCKKLCIVAILLFVFGGQIIFAQDVQQDLQVAVKLRESEQFESAKAKFEELIKKYPKEGDVFYQYGEFYLKTFFVDTAIASIKEVSDPAKEMFNKGIQTDVNDPLNYVGLLKVELLNNNPQGAKQYYDIVKSLLPTRQNKIDMEDTRHAFILMKMAESYVKGLSNDTALVFPMLRKSESLNKKDPEFYIIKGDAYLYINNDGSSAIYNYKKAQELDPKSPKAKLRLGQLWVRAKKYNEALNYYKEAISIDTTFAPAYREIAEIYAMAGQYEQAEKNYEHFNELSPNNISAKVRYASFLFLTKKYDQSLKIINEVQAVDKSFNVLNRLAAYSYFETKQCPKGLVSIELFFKGTKPEKIIPSDYAYYARLLACSDKDSLAILKYNEAYKADSTDLSLISDMAKIYSKGKKWNEAAKTYEKKIAKKSTLQDNYDLGKCYYNMRQWGKADTAFSRVIEAKPDFFQAVKYRAQCNSNIDSTSEKGIAKPYYEELIKLSLKDSAKYSKDLVVAYSYLSYYYFKQYNTTKKCEEAKNSIAYCEKILTIDPKNSNATDIKKALKLKCP